MTTRDRIFWDDSVPFYLCSVVASLMIAWGLPRP